MRWFQTPVRKQHRGRPLLGWRVDEGLMHDIIWMDQEENWRLEGNGNCYDYMPPDLYCLIEDPKEEQCRSARRT